MTESAREARLQGLATEWRTMTYTWRDCALYALAVGAGGAEPQYTYERDMQAIPTFGATPYWGTVNVTPKLPRPRSTRCWWRSLKQSVSCQPGVTIFVSPPLPR